MKPSPPSLVGLLMLGATIASYADYPAEVLADNPVAYWRLDDVDGSNVADSSGNNHHGAVDGGAGSITFGEPGLLPTAAANGSITLAGFDRIIVPGFEKIGPNGFTAEYWVNVTQYPAACCDSLVSDGVSGGDFFMMNYLIGPGQGTNGAIRPHFGVPGTVSITSNADPLDLNTPHHVVTTYDVGAGMGHVYVNGVAILSSPVVATLPAPGTTGNNDIFIGRDGRENRPSNFKIDEVALYDFPLTPQRIAAHFEAGTGGVAPPTNYEEEVLFDNPLAYWRFNESDGPQTADISGHGRNATASGDAIFGAETLVPPDSDSAILFSGNGQVVSPGFAKSDTGTSLDFWVKFSSAPAGGEFINLVGDREAGELGDGHLFVEAGAGGVIRATIQTDSGTTSISSPEGLADERMHHVVATWDAASGAFVLYIDGAEAASANQAGPAGVANTDHAIFIGGGGPGAEPGFHGIIDEVAVYDFPVAADRVAARFNRVDVPPPPPPPVVNGNFANAVLADGPIAYWRLDEGDGSIVYDRSGNNHHGEQDGVTGSISYGGESLVPAESGNGSISLAGFDRLIFPGFEKVGADGWSAEYWVKVTAFPGAGNCCDNFVGDGVSAGDFFMMNYLIDSPQGDQGAIRPHFNGTSSVSITTTVPNVLELDTIYHVVTNWDRTAGMGNVYVNGELWLSGFAAGNPAAGSTGNDVFIGRDNRENRPSNFMIDEVALYDYPLTPEQILNHYNVGLNPEPNRVVITDISRNPTSNEIRISWESKFGKLYHVRSETDPSVSEPPSWPIFGGLQGLLATPPENTVTFNLPGDSKRFFVIEETDAPPVTRYVEDFDLGDGGWTTGAAGDDGTEWEHGSPTGVGPLAAHSEPNCFGTDLDNFYGDELDIWLRSPAIDLTDVGAATLHFNQYIDAEISFDRGIVSILDAADDSLLAEVEDRIDGNMVGWEEVSYNLSAAAGKVIVLEFRFNTDILNDDSYAGWYIDDVQVTIP